LDLLGEFVLSFGQGRAGGMDSKNLMNNEPKNQMKSAAKAGAFT
jgi:hypothetical protein